MPRPINIQLKLQSLADPVIAEHSQRYFKTGPGQYGEGDLFRGIRVPVLRKVAWEHRDLTFGDAVALLQSPFHEDRLTALLIWVLQYEKGDEAARARIYGGYMDNRGRVNNWDLVDLSAPRIVGAQLEKRNKAPLNELVRSPVLWDRRIAVLATFWLINIGRFTDSLRFARILLNDPEDLMHKAAGWMLREIGNRDQEAEEAFLKKHYRAMPRTMLRYAIERFPEKKRKAYLDGII